jgi:hypothetical protein
LPDARYPLDPSRLALLLANLLPVAGVLWLGWDVGPVVVLYWVENLIVGAYTILKMLVAGGVHALFRIAFFCLHYGGFCAIHGVFVLKLTHLGANGQEAAAVSGWPGPLVVIEKFVMLAQQILAFAPDELLWACLALLISHGASFLLLYLGEQEFRHTTVDRLMIAPYRRIALLHVAVIAGGFLVKYLGSPLGLLLALVALKTGMDIMLHIRSHRTPDSVGQADGPAGQQRGE